MLPFTDEARFWKYVDKAGDDECWVWKGTVKKNGYGQFWLNGKPDRAHRVSYRMGHGEIPNGLLIRHTCDNKVCVNPAHLLLGTVKDNSRDAIERGLYPRWEKQGRAVLTNSQVREILLRIAAGQTQKSLAAEFGVCTSTISFIATRRNWVGIEEAQ